MKSLLLTLLLSGCASGVVMTDEERAACYAQGCSVFTESAIRSLIGKVFNDAFRLGWIEATKKKGTDL